MHKVNPKTKFATVITIFSAPNYCSIYHNKGAVIHFHDNTLDIMQFRAAQQPFFLPKLMDAFTCSLPFLAENISEIFCNLLKETESETYSLPSLPELTTPIRHRLLTGDKLKVVELAARLSLSLESNEINHSSAPKVKITGPKCHTQKVEAVMRMIKIYRTLREEHELVMRLKEVCPDNRIKMGVVMQGRTGLETELRKFQTALESDAHNERRPCSLTI